VGSAPGKRGGTQVTETAKIVEGGSTKSCRSEGSSKRDKEARGQSQTGRVSSKAGIARGRTFKLEDGEKKKEEEDPESGRLKEISTILGLAVGLIASGLSRQSNPAGGSSQVERDNQTLGESVSKLYIHSLKVLRRKASGKGRSDLDQAGTAWKRRRHPRCKDILPGDEDSGEIKESLLKNREQSNLLRSWGEPGVKFCTDERGRCRGGQN